MDKNFQKKIFLAFFFSIFLSITFFHSLTQSMLNAGLFFSSLLLYTVNIDEKRPSKLQTKWIQSILVLQFSDYYAVNRKKRESLP